MKYKSMLKYTIPLVMGLSGYSCTNKADHPEIMEPKKADIDSSAMVSFAKKLGYTAPFLKQISESLGQKKPYQEDKEEWIFGEKTAINYAIENARAKGISPDNLAEFIYMTKGYGYYSHYSTEREGISMGQYRHVIDISINLITNGIDFNEFKRYTEVGVWFPGEMIELKQKGISPQKIASLDWIKQFDNFDSSTYKGRLDLEEKIQCFVNAGVFSYNQLREYASFGAFTDKNSWSYRENDFQEKVKDLVYLEATIGESAAKKFFALNKEGANLNTLEVKEFVKSGVSYERVKNELRKKREQERLDKLNAEKENRKKAEEERKKAEEKKIRDAID